MRISVVATVLNEANTLPHLLDSLATQTHLPDEVIVCDGGSTDATLSVLETYQAAHHLPLRFFQQLGGNISQGRNAAIEAATGDVIAVTDAGVRLSQNWLEKITAPFAEAGTEAVAGFFVSDPQTAFETAMGATVLPALREVDPTRFLPSSRSVAFRKRAWAEVGGYPEWLDYCEDLIFDLRIRDRYGPFVFAPQATVHFRPRPSLRAFFVQYYRYARGDGKAGLWRERHLIRYLTYLVAAPLVAVAGMTLNPRWWALFLLSLPGMFWTGWRRLVQSWQRLSLGQKAQALIWVPVIRVAGDLAKMIGYPVGVWWRWSYRAQVPDWRQS
jgi:glycosyltransferase involved in cell wall biosynthesis